MLARHSVARHGLQKDKMRHGVALPAKVAQRSAGALDAAAGFLEDIGRGGVGDAEGRTLAERRALHHRQALGLEQVVHEVGVVLDHLAVRRLLADRAGARRIDVERALRPRALEALGLVQHRHDQVAALLEHRDVLGDEIGRAVERRHRRRLADRAGVRGALALHRDHGVDQLLRAGRIADAPAGHAVGLGHAVHGQRAVVEPGLDLGRRRELEVVIDQLLVHVVGQDVDLRMLQQHVAQRPQVGLACRRHRSGCWASSG